MELVRQEKMTELQSIIVDNFPTTNGVVEPLGAPNISLK